MKGREDVERMRREGNRLLDEGRFKEAEDVLSEAFGIAPEPALLNNWAVCRFHQGDAEGTLQLLEANLAGDELAPFARALAAQTHAMLGRTDEAQKQLNQAIIDFEEGIRELTPLGRDAMATWWEYTVILKRAAGDLGRHQLVIDLYRRHEFYHATMEDRYLAGVAAFNLGRMNQAVSYWSKLPRPDWGFTDMFIDVARKADIGVIPQFLLEYRIPNCDQFSQAESEEEWIEATRMGSTRMMFVYAVLNPDAAPWTMDDIRNQLHFIVKGDPEWGIEFAHNLLTYPGASRQLKAAAAAALTMDGVYSPGEPINIVYEDGTESQIVVQSHSVVLEHTPHSAEALCSALQLMEREDYDAALHTLLPVLDDDRVDYRIYLAIATAHIGKGNLDEAENVLTMMDEIIPEHPLLLLKFAELYLAREDREKAVSYLERIDVKTSECAVKEAVEAVISGMGKEPFKIDEFRKKYGEHERERQE